MQLMTNLLRQPKGQPIGGQFAPSANPEATVALDAVAMSDVEFKARCSVCPGKCSVKTQQESMDWKRKHEKFTKHKVELSWSRKAAESITTDEEIAMSNHDHVRRENAGLAEIGEVACSRPAPSSRNCASVGSLSDCGESVSSGMSVRER
jgi:adenine-specific DNA glycosylase